MAEINRDLSSLIMEIINGDELRGTLPEITGEGMGGFDVIAQRRLILATAARALRAYESLHIGGVFLIDVPTTTHPYREVIEFGAVDSRVGDSGQARMTDKGS